MNKTLQLKIRQLYQKGMSLRDIGDKLVMSHEAVRKAIPANEMRRKRMSTKTENQILKVFKETGSYQETAERLKLRNRQVVYRVVERNYA